MIKEVAEMFNFGRCLGIEDLDETVYEFFKYGELFFDDPNAAYPLFIQKLKELGLCSGSHDFFRSDLTLEKAYKVAVAAHGSELQVTEDE